jgi:CDP-glucose 4,6-dehydratase
VRAPDYTGMGVLVTGAQGFMGSWLVEALLDGGARVIVPRREAPPGSRFQTEQLDRRCELVDADLRDLPSTLRIVNECEVELIFHLAAQTLVATANEAPLATFETNVRGTYTLLEASRLRPDPPRVVVASSYHAYGSTQVGPYSEDAALRPRWPYDVSKACADLIARCYAETYGMPVGVTRLANVYGGGDLNFSRIVPNAARALVTGGTPIIQSDGTPERDYIYVEDAVRAYLGVADSLLDTSQSGRAWNAGSDEPVSVVELVGKLIAASGREVEPSIEGRANPRDEIDRQYLDSSSARRELDWAPVWTLEEGLAKTYRWYQQNAAAITRSAAGAPAG